MGSIGLTNAANNFFSVFVKKADTEQLAMEENGVIRTKAAAIFVHVKGLGKKRMTGEISTRTYQDSYSLWDNPESRNAFFAAMYLLHKKNSLFSIATEGSAQAAYNREIGAAIGRMRGLQGKP